LRKGPNNFCSVPIATTLWIIPNQVFKILDLAEAILAGSGNVMSDKRFLGPTLDITTDTGDIRHGGVSSVWTNRKPRLRLNKSGPIGS
jgi:hypothetical protein